MNTVLATPRDTMLPTRRAIFSLKIPTGKIRKS